MKKLILAAAVVAAGAFCANAEDYNRGGITYDHTSLGLNKNMKDVLDVDGLGTNGFGINYVHGFGISNTLPMFIETGLNLNFNFGSENVGKKETEGDYWMQEKMSMQNINMQIPVNFVYKFALTDDITLSPYIGLNFKLNLVNKYKYKIDTNISDSDLEDAGIDKKDLEGEWINTFSDSNKNMGSKDWTWNRFQMGWQIGVGVNYKPFYLGLQYGTDFIPAYKHEFKEDNYKETYKVSSGTFRLTLGYNF